MINFEFVQASEFDDPFYSIENDGNLGEIYFFDGQWVISWIYGATKDDLSWIYWKLDELNQSTKSQRILGVF